MRYNVGMKERIKFVWRNPQTGHVLSIERKPFDMAGYGNEDGSVHRQCWVRYRGGRLFVSSANYGPWTPFRFEPKNGNAYDL